MSLGLGRPGSHPRTASSLPGDLDKSSNSSGSHVTHLSSGTVQPCQEGAVEMKCTNICWSTSWVLAAGLSHPPSMGELKGQVGQASFRHA